MTKLEKELKSALDATLEWIDAVPSDTILPTMPGFDRDWVEGIRDRASRAPAAMSENRQQHTPAFPGADGYLNGNGEWIHPENTGMTLRDYFAAKSMQALINSDVLSKIPREDIRKVLLQGSKDAYEIADAMLSARAATGKGVQGG